MLHVLADEVDVSHAVDADPVLFSRHFTVLVYDEFLGVAAVDADELEAALALVDAVELAVCLGEYMSLKGLLHIWQCSAS
jgi:hypothetical protein